MTDDRCYLRWVKGLRQLFLDCELEEVNVQSRYEPYTITPMSSELLCVVSEECASSLSDLGSAELLRSLSRNAHTEMRHGTTVSKVLQVVMGKKPGPEHGESALNHSIEQKSRTEEQISGVVTSPPNIKLENSSTSSPNIKLENSNTSSPNTKLENSSPVPVRDDTPISSQPWSGWTNSALTMSDIQWPDRRN